MTKRSSKPTYSMDRFDIKYTGGYTFYDYLLDGDATARRSRRSPTSHDRHRAGRRLCRRSDRRAGRSIGWRLRHLQRIRRRCIPTSQPLSRKPFVLLERDQPDLDGSTVRCNGCSAPISTRRTRTSLARSSTCEDEPLAELLLRSRPRRRRQPEPPPAVLPQHQPVQRLRRLWTGRLRHQRSAEGHGRPALVEGRQGVEGRGLPRLLHHLRRSTISNFTQPR